MNDIPHETKAKEAVPKGTRPDDAQDMDAQDILRDLSDRKACAWLWDPARNRMVWATQAATLFWSEPTILDLVDRDFGEEDPVVVRLAQAFAHLERGSDAQANLKFNPENKPVWATCRLHRIDLDHDAEALLVEVITIDEDRGHMGAPLASVEAALARHSALPLALYAVDGSLVTQNEACRRLFEGMAADDFMSRLDDKTIAGKIMLRSLADGYCSRTRTMPCIYGRRLFKIAASRTHHPGSSVPALVVFFQDVTDTREIWNKTAEALAHTPKAAAIAPEPQEEKYPSLHDIGKLLDGLPDPLFTLDEDGAITSVNQAGRTFIAKKLRISAGDAATYLVGQLLPNLLKEPLRREVETALSLDRGTKAPAVIVHDRSGHLDPAEGLKGPITISLGRLHGTPGVHYAQVRDLTEQQKTQTGLIKAHDRAQARDQEKLDFIAQISHEMRTPLNAILGFSEIMELERLGPIDNPRYKDYLHDIHRSSEFLLSLVNDLLDFSKIESGKMELDLTEVGLKDIIQACLSMLRPQAQKANIALKMQVIKDLPHVVADGRSVQQILLNLLSNALKYSNSGSEVCVRAEINPKGGVVMQVRDTGPGMTPTDLESAMQPYMHAKSQHKKTPSGETIESTGLGLPLAKSLTEANKADFDIQSTPGQGTVITITFPSTLVLA